MNTLKIIEGQRDTVGDNWADSIDRTIRENLIWYKENGNDHGDLVISEEAIKGKVIDWHMSSIKEILTAEIERLELQRPENCECGGLEHECEHWGRHEMIDDQVTHFKNLIEKLK